MKRSYPESAGSSGSRELIGALLDFETLPGRYPLTLREPRALFDHCREVLLLASGRPLGGMVLDPIDAPGVQRAACFFVRMAMLRPGADHYTLLGVEPGFQKEALRDHYRMLIRLTHPDFVASSGAWPAGAATRINLANDVLSSVVRKAEYDRLRVSDARPVGPVNRLAAILPHPMQRERPARWGWAAAAAAAGIGSLAFVLVQWQSGNIEDFHPDLVAQGNYIPHKSALAIDTSSIKSAGEPHKSPKDPKSTTSSSAAQSTAIKSPGEVAKEAQAVKEAQSAKTAQAARAAQEAQLAEAAKVAQAAKVAKEAQAAKLAQAEQAAKEIQIAKAAQAARAAQEAQLAEAAKVAQTAKVAKEAQAAKLAQAATEARIVQAAKVVQAAKEAQATRVALTTPVTQEVQLAQPVLAVALVKPLAVPPQSPAIEPSARLNLADAQPALNQLIQSMQAGRGDELLRGLDRSVRHSGGAADLVNAYNLLVGGSRAVRLGPVKLRGRPNADQLAVDGVVQLVLQDQGQPPPVRELHLRALFVQRDGQVVMTELSTGGARP